MNKTIFRLNYKASVIILCGIAILLSFLSNIFYVNGIVEYIFYIFRCFLFTAIFFFISLIENKNSEFKELSKRLTGYFILLNLLNIIFALFSTFHVLKSLFLTFSGILCMILVCLCILEIINLYMDRRGVKRVINLAERLANIVINPLIKWISERKL